MLIVMQKLLDFDYGESDDEDGGRSSKEPAQTQPVSAAHQL